MFYYRCRCFSLGCIIWHPSCWMWPCLGIAYPSEWRTWSCDRVIFENHCTKVALLSYEHSRLQPPSQVAHHSCYFKSGGLCGRHLQKRLSLGTPVHLLDFILLSVLLDQVLYFSNLRTLLIWIWVGAKVKFVFIYSWIHHIGGWLTHILFEPSWNMVFFHNNRLFSL